MLKKIIITGVNGRIARHLTRYLAGWEGLYEVVLLSLRDDLWKDMSFQGYDAVIHLAALVHRKEKPSMEQQFERLNVQLPRQVAQKAKEEGVGLFVYASSLAVYGLEGSVQLPQTIDENTAENPASLYGKSKWRGEQLVGRLNDEQFRVVVLRVPLVYGAGCKGSYGTLRAVALKLPMVPRMENRRSMIHLDNLSEFIRLLIERPSSGTFFPQNREFVCTSDLIQHVANAHGKRLRQSPFWGGFFRRFLGRLGLVEKIWGTLVIGKELSTTFGWDYNVLSFEDSFADESA